MPSIAVRKAARASLSRVLIGVQSHEVRDWARSPVPPRLIRLPVRPHSILISPASQLDDFWTLRRMHFSDSSEMKLSARQFKLSRTPTFRDELTL